VLDRAFLIADDMTMFIPATGDRWGPAAEALGTRPKPNAPPVIAAPL
jgi:hypothetical protein